MPEEISKTELIEVVKPNWLRKNYGKMSIILAMGAASGLTNIKHGPGAVFLAGLKQSAYSTLSAVFLLSIYNTLEKRVKSIPGELIPIIVPTLLTIAANLTVHTLKGTEEPVLSTLPTAIAAGIGFPIWHVRTRILQLWEGLEKMEIKL